MTKDDYVWVPSYVKRLSDGRLIMVSGYWKQVERTQYPHASSPTFSRYTSSSGSSVLEFWPSGNILTGNQKKKKRRKIS